MVFFLDAVQTHYVGSVFVGDNILRAKPAAERGNRCGCGILLVCLLALPVDCWCQNQNSAGNATAPANRNSEGGSDSLARFVGLPIRSISFQGVAVSRLNPLAAQLAEEQGKALSREFLKGSLRQLYETGLFDGIDVAGSSEQGGVALVFRGTPRSFIGTVSVDGAKGATINTQLERASQLTPGTRFTEAKLSQALELMRKAEAENGFPDPDITHTLTPHPEDQLIDIAFRVVSGPQARVGAEPLRGAPEMSSNIFPHLPHLTPGSSSNQDPGTPPLPGFLKHYKG